MPFETITCKKLKFVGAGVVQHKYVDAKDASDGLHRIAGPSSLQPENMAEAAELRGAIIKIIHDISSARGETPEHAEENFELLCMHFGLDGPPMTYRAISAETGISASSISNRINKLVRIVREDEKYKALLQDYK